MGVVELMVAVAVVAFVLLAVYYAGRSRGKREADSARHRPGNTAGPAPTEADRDAPH